MIHSMHLHHRSITAIFLTKNVFDVALEKSLTNTLKVHLLGFIFVAEHTVTQLLPTACLPAIIKALAERIFETIILKGKCSFKTKQQSSKGWMSVKLSGDWPFMKHQAAWSIWKNNDAVMLRWNHAFVAIIIVTVKGSMKIGALVRNYRRDNECQTGPVVFLYLTHEDNTQSLLELLPRWYYTTHDPLTRHIPKCSDQQGRSLLWFYWFIVVTLFWNLIGKRWHLRCIPYGSKENSHTYILYLWWDLFFFNLNWTLRVCSIELFDVYYSPLSYILLEANLVWS